MPLFKALRESLNIFTPKKSTTKKPQIVASKASYNPTTTTANSSLAARLQNQRMSPDARTEEWLRNNSPEKKVVRFENSGTPSVLGVKGGGISKKTNTPNSTRTSKRNHTAAGSSLRNMPEKKRNSSIWNLLGFGSKTEDEGTPQSGLLTPADDRDIEGATVDEETLVDDEGTLDGPSILEGSTLLVQDESGDLKVQNDDKSSEDEEEDFSDFSTEEYFLFHKLNARGFEPIIHLGWAMDFRTLPEVLFSDDRKETYIKHIFSPEYHGNPPTPSFSITR